MLETRKVIICDDEEDARIIIKQYLIEFDQLLLIEECTNGLDAVQKINTLEPDLIFLDIQMPGLSGFQVLQKLIHIPQIIFSTAFDNYALKAFDNNAADYLLKPYTKERFKQAVNKVLLQSNKNLEGIKSLSENFQKIYTAYPEKVMVETGSKMIAINTNDIYWIEANGDYTKLHIEQKSFISNYGISALEQKLNPSIFMRIHRSAIININLIKEIYRDTNGYYAVLQNNSTHKIGRNYTDIVKKISL